MPARDAGPEAVRDNAAGGRGKYVDYRGAARLLPLAPAPETRFGSSTCAILVRRAATGLVRPRPARHHRPTFARHAGRAHGAADRHGRPRPHGRQHGPAHRAGRARRGGVGRGRWRTGRHRRRGAGAGRRVAGGAGSGAAPAARSVAHAASGSPDRGHGRPVARAARQGRRDRGWRQRLLSRQRAACRGARTARHPSGGCGRVRRRVGSGERLWPDGRRRGRGRVARRALPAGAGAGSGATAGCTAVRAAPDTSPRWCTTASSTA